MTHEPECPEFEYDRPPLKANCVCANIRAAYQRGREDAATAVATTPLFSYLADGPMLVHYGEAIAAARGDGEQE